MGTVSADCGFGDAAFPEDRSEIARDRLFGSVESAANGAVGAYDRS